MVGYEPEKVRAINFSVTLQHLKRALLAAHAEDSIDSPRPLLVLDHLREAAYHSEDPNTKKMLAHLMKWCTATCYDDGLCDVAICDDFGVGGWRRGSGKAQYFQ